MMRKIGMVGALVGLMTLVLGSTALHAADDDNARVQYRKGVMSSVGGHMGALACHVKGQCNLDPKVLKRAAGSIAFLGELSIAAFKVPTPTATEKTTSHARIWTEWEGFEKGLRGMSQKVTALKAAAATGDRAVMGPALGAVGKQCKGCHDHYREKK